MTNEEVKSQVEVIYFQPKGINPNYCEAGMLMDNDKDYIYCLDEPCKILLTDVKIIPSENVVVDKRRGVYKVIKKDEN